MILGNNFLIENKANINFIQKTLTLNNSLTVPIFNNQIQTNLNNITETITDIFTLPTNYSIAHCISAD